jgi:thiol-disulfide isomerase/thioredoxin
MAGVLMVSAVKRGTHPVPKQVEPTRLGSIFAAVFLTASGVGATRTPGLAQEADIGLRVGTVPEPVVVEDLDGNEVDLADFIGEKPVLIEFWATWCENCEALLPRMRTAHESYGERVQFLAVAVAVGQSKRAVRRHLGKHPVAYPTLWDGKGQAVRGFKAPVTSYIVVLDADGRVAYTGVGPDQDIEAAIGRVISDES